MGKKGFILTMNVCAYSLCVCVCVCARACVRIVSVRARVCVRIREKDTSIVSSPWEKEEREGFIRGLHDWCFRPFGDIGGTTEKDVRDKRVQIGLRMQVYLAARACNYSSKNSAVLA